MQCPNCRSTIIVGRKCKSCGIDFILFLRILRLSDKLYNRGLDRLKSGDFFHGIDYLSKSVSVNKGNVPARNLLGIALFVVGHVGDALLHWVLSYNIQKENNPALKYINNISENHLMVEQLSDAVSLYNKALNNIKQASDDIAVIQLKKAVDINPSFVDALNLLALCHLIQNNRERALSVVESVLAIDVQNPIAHNYMSHLRPAAAQPPKLMKPVDPQPSGEGQLSPAVIPFKQPELSEPGIAKPRSYHFAEALAFTLGAVGAAVLFFFILMPATEDRHNETMAAFWTEMAHTKAVHQDELQVSIVAIEGLGAEIVDLNEEIVELEAFVDFLQRIVTVYEAQTFFLEDRYEEAVDILGEVSLAGLPPDVQAIADLIHEHSYPLLGSSLYQTGLEAFNDADYALALVSLTRAHRFLAPRHPEEPYPAQWNQLLFMLGRINYFEGEFLAAHQLLTELRERAPELQEALVAQMLESISTRIDLDEQEDD